MLCTADFFFLFRVHRRFLKNRPESNLKSQNSQKNDAKYRWEQGPSSVGNPKFKSKSQAWTCFWNHQKRLKTKIILNETRRIELEWGKNILDWDFPNASGVKKIHIHGSILTCFFSSGFSSLQITDKETKTNSCIVFELIQNSGCKTPGSKCTLKIWTLCISVYKRLVILFLNWTEIDGAHACGTHTKIGDSVLHGLRCEDPCMLVPLSITRNQDVGATSRFYKTMINLKAANN